MTQSLQPAGVPGPDVGDARILPAYVDELVIGGSPLLLMHAARQAARGRSVLLVERHLEFGGAWLCASWDGLTKVELGSHYLYCNAAAYEWLEQAGVDLVPMEPVPYFWRRRRLPIWRSHKVGAVRKAILRRSPTVLVRELLRAATYGRYYYPREGAAGLLEALVTHAETSGVTLLNGASCTRVAVGRDEVTCEVDGTSVRAGRLVTGESCDLGVLTVEGEPFALDTRTVSRTHRLMRVSSRSCTPLTYVEVERHGLLKRVSLAHRPPGADTVLCVQVPESADVEQCRDALAELGIVTEDCEVTASTIVRYEQAMVPERSSRRLHRRTRLMRVVPTQNCLGDSLVWYLSPAGRRLLADL